MKRFIWIVLVMVLTGQTLLGWWQKSDSQVSVREMERTLSRLEKLAWKIEKMSDVNWNPVYAGLCYKINDYGRPVIPLLLRDVQDKSKDWKYRYMITDRLIFVKGKIADDQWLICGVLMEIAESRDEEKDLRKNSINALSRLAGTSSLMDDERRKKVTRNVVNLATDHTEIFQIRWEAIRNLSRFAKYYGDILLEPLLGLSSNANNKIRAISISTLVIVAHFAQDNTLKSHISLFLVNRLQVEQDNLVKDQIVYGIKTLKVREAIPLLMKSLKTSRYCHKSQAAELLGIMKVREAVPDLIEALKDNSLDFVRGRAAFALGEIGDKGAVEPLIDFLLSDKSGAYLDAAKALGKIGDRSAIQPLMNRFSKSPFHPWMVEALIRLDAHEAIPLIEEKMPKGKLYGSEAETKENFEKFKRGEKIEWEKK